MNIHILKQQGLSIRKIAAVLGVSRNAVRRALRAKTVPTGSRRRLRGVKLSPYTAQIGAWMRDDAKRHWTAERIFDELQTLGYDGGRTVLKEYVATVRPRKPTMGEARFYVKPGQQMQVDWGEMGRVSIGGVERKVYAFVAIMAWSRALFICATTDMQLLTWLDCHRRAFEFFGGVPREVLIDNLKTGVASRAGKTIQWHASYNELAVGFGFRPLAHFPMRPKTKGRVERIVRFARERFFAGREIADLSQTNLEALQWLRERANTRVHRITRERPCDRFEIERAALAPLHEYDVVLEQTRIADAYGLVNVKGVRYSVPAMHARKPAIVQVRVDSLRILIDGEIVAQHGYPAPGVRLVQDPKHLPPKPEPRHDAFTRLGNLVTERLGEIGRQYVHEVERKAPHAPLAILREILERHDEYGTAVLQSALQSVLEFEIVKRGTVSRLCERFGAIPGLNLTTTGVLPQIHVEQRHLSVYDGTAA
jgi:transposase